VRSALSGKTSTELKRFFGNKRLVILDEAQRVQNIGLTLKLVADTYPNLQIIATGSSSFDLSNKIEEPLTGRKLEFYLYPLSLEELARQHSALEIQRLLPTRMVYGMYPEIALGERSEEKQLKEIAKSYVYKDILQFDALRNADAIDKLIKALALQIGNEVSYNELASLVGINKNTVQKYIRILEQAFIIFRLNPFSKNARKELKKMRKVYFFDTGIRNALINNLNPLELRQDTGVLFENFMISERIKFLHNRGKSQNSYFWRTHQGAEVDYMEETNGIIAGYEFKWNKKTFRPPASFMDLYPQSSLSLINRHTFQSFVKFS
jgi:predicted AAA+ superfamily ATPase